MSNIMIRWPWFALISAIAVLDQWTKGLALNSLEYANPVSWLPFLNMSLSYNRGVAFGWLSQSGGLGMILLYGFIGLVIASLIVWLVKTQASEKLQSLALSFILGGAIGNYIDRIFRGYVVDFIDFHWGGWHFHTFNVADSFITVGAMFLLLMAFMPEKKRSEGKV